MHLTVSYSILFREARERAGLSTAEAARRMCVSTSALKGIESEDDELPSVHSAADVQRFGSVLGVRSCELLGVESQAEPLTAEELAALICNHCRERGKPIGAFEDAAGWCVGRSLEKPERLLHDYSISGIQDICRELDVAWERFIMSL